MAAKNAPNGADDGEWVGNAWADWCAGERNLAALGRKYGHKPQTVKKYLASYSKARAAEVAHFDPTAEYLDGLHHDLCEALQTYRNSENPNAKVGALKHATAVRELIAAVSGVITKREGRELSGTGGAPLFGGMTDEQLESLLASAAVGDPGGTGEAKGGGNGSAGGD